jgi:hypothetical protein
MMGTAPHHVKEPCRSLAAVPGPPFGNFSLILFCLLTVLSDYIFLSQDISALLFATGHFKTSLYCHPERQRRV